jgi:hypothetical protein
MEKITTKNQIKCLKNGDFIIKYPIDSNSDSLNSFDTATSENIINFWVSKNDNELQELELTLTPSDILQTNLVGGNHDLVIFRPLKKDYIKIIEDGKWWKLT